MTLTLQQHPGGMIFLLSTTAKIIELTKLNRVISMVKHFACACSLPFCQGTACFVDGALNTVVPPVFHHGNFCTCQDNVNNTYHCIRILNATHNWVSDSKNV